MTDESGFFDHEGLAQLVEKLADAVRPLGLTIQAEMVVMSATPQGQLLMVPMEVRPSAKQRLDEDKASRDEFNKMMAENHEAMIREQADKIRGVAGDETKLEDLLFGEAETECAHERKHPDGFCLDCGEGME